MLTIGERYLDPKNKSVLHVIRYGKDKCLGVATNPCTGEVTTVLKGKVGQLKRMKRL